MSDRFIKWQIPSSLNRFWWPQMIPAFAFMTWETCLCPWNTRVMSTAAARSKRASGEEGSLSCNLGLSILNWNLHVALHLLCKNWCILGWSSYSHDYSFIVSGSEDKYVYIWSTYHDLSKFTSVRRDRNDFWEGIKGNCAACWMTNCILI